MLDRGGNVVIPSFAVGRTQEILYFLREIQRGGLVRGHGDFPVYMDSPLANEATGIFLQCDESNFDDNMRDMLAQCESNMSELQQLQVPPPAPPCSPPSPRGHAALWGSWDPTDRGAPGGAVSILLFSVMSVTSCPPPVP